MTFSNPLFILDLLTMALNRIAIVELAQPSSEVENTLLSNALNIRLFHGGSSYSLFRHCKIVTKKVFPVLCFIFIYVITAVVLEVFCS